MSGAPCARCSHDTDAHVMTPAASSHVPCEAPGCACDDFVPPAASGRLGFARAVGRVLEGRGS